MKHVRPINFPQSASILDKASEFCPTKGLAFLVKRAKGARLHTLDGRILDDFWLEAGRLPFGHAAAFLGQIQKNHVSSGSLHGYPQPVHFRLLSRLARLLPGYQIQFVNSADIAPVSDELDLTRTAFTESLHLLPENERPARIRINGALGLDIIASQSALQIDSYWPDAIMTARALALLGKMMGPAAPWASCAKRADRFAKKIGSALLERKSASVKIELDKRLRAALLNEGFYTGEDGWLYFCAEHDPRTVDRLARTILRLQES